MEGKLHATVFFCRMLIIFLIVNGCKTRQQQENYSVNSAIAANHEKNSGHADYTLNYFYLQDKNSLSLAVSSSLDNLKKIDDTLKSKQISGLPTTIPPKLRESKALTASAAEYESPPTGC